MREIRLLTTPDLFAMRDKALRIAATRRNWKERRQAQRLLVIVTTEMIRRGL